MDSITHLFYGGAIAALIAPAKHRRAALLAGAALNTLPDLDVIPLLLFGDPVAQMTWHRGPTHSWLLLPFLAWALWSWFKRRGGRVAEQPRRWFRVFMITVLAHRCSMRSPFYGTQLLWPLADASAMWSSLFLPIHCSTCMVLACVIAWFAGGNGTARAGRRDRSRLSATSAGHCWRNPSFEREAASALARRAGRMRAFRADAFNTLLWRVVAMTRAVTSRANARWSPIAARWCCAAMPRMSRRWPKRAGSRRMAAAGLVNTDSSKRGWSTANWCSRFAHGLEPDYLFRFAVARRDGKGLGRDRTRSSISLGSATRAGHGLARIWTSPITRAAACRETPATSASK